MQSEPSPSAIRIIREGQRVELDWADGHQSQFDAVALRWLCPCAYCRGEAGLLAGSMPIRHSRSSRPPSPVVSSLEAMRSVSSGPTDTGLATTRGHCCVATARVLPASALRMPDTHEQSRRLVVSRELSALAFNARVLHEARDSRTPLLDRFKFLGIVASNIDEFFGVRVSGIREQIDAGVQAASADGRSCRTDARDS